MGKRVRQLGDDPHIAGIRPARGNLRAEGGKTGGSHARVLIEEETELLHHAKEIPQIEEQKK